jgi:RHH-type proline utilization regulon transcriptional repressor/proline dehydrogenase/delta 1-pyrroline-5-carboxylate dehydrogenase
MKKSKGLTEAKAALNALNGKKITANERREAAITIAASLLEASLENQTHLEQEREEKISGIITDPKGKAFTAAVTDYCFRSHNPIRAADQLKYTIAEFGIPRFLPWKNKIGLSALKLFGKSAGSLLIPLVQNTIRHETATVILPAEKEKLDRHLEKRRLENVRLNLNHIGEAILGEQEAKSRFKLYLNDLKNPEIECISIKISTIYSQIHLIAREQTLEKLAEKLRQLYRAAQQNLFTGHGEPRPKFVNLDMEEFRDLHLTINLFKKVLNEPEFHQFSAGIVLQSYLPESFILQQQLTEWAKERIKNNGAPIKIRLVKGANLAMEQVEASLRGWPQAPYSSKTDVDANFKRMLSYGCLPENAKAVHLGIGSHNLFDIAYALILRAENHVEDNVEFEMLEGMADHMRRVVQAISNRMLLYCPIATSEEFQYAVAYLVRRLDENTAPDNFLRHAFSMVPGTDEWRQQILFFSMGCDSMDKIDIHSRRQQNRWDPPRTLKEDALFENEPDTDWSLPQNSTWGLQILEDWKKKEPIKIPLVIDGKEVYSSSQQSGYDPSHPDKELYTYTLAGTEQIDQAIAAAQQAALAWSSTSHEIRCQRLIAAAQTLREERAALIGAMVADTGKPIAEGDAEVSEAIDFAEYYSRNLEELHGLQDINWHAKGVVLVASPWNFPCSIPAGGILAALAGGNAVIFKPAPEAVLVGWHLAQALWESGIGKDVLQFITCKDDPEGTRMIKDPGINSVILTGATATAKIFLKIRPGLDLMAETGGKNSMIVTAMSDRDLAIKDILQSAFGYAGQKCSACSLLILEAEVYDDANFMKSLKDAASSLQVGSPWDPTSKINPLIHPPEQALKQAIDTLEAGESWLLEPKQIDPANPRLWSPGIKLGVKPNSFTYRNELFGPLLAIVKADNLNHAIQLANGTPYGLTAGLHSLDDREQKKWMSTIQTGNGYINRGITGAIVQRQPFGGCKQSSFGPGAKAGGPNYLMQLMHPSQVALPEEQEALPPPLQTLNASVEKSLIDAGQIKLWKASLGSYAFYWKRYFSKDHDPSLLLGQDNLFRYIPHAHQTLRIQPNDKHLDIFRVIAAALTCGAPLEISCPLEILKEWVKADWRQSFPQIIIQAESEQKFCERIAKGNIKRIRYLSVPSDLVKDAAAAAGCNLIEAHTLANGRLELLRHLREVCFSIDYHRYGYLGTRDGEKRTALPLPMQQVINR